MCRKLIGLVSLAFMLSLVLPGIAKAHPKPIAWWKFDGDALDSSGNGHHGTLMGDPAPIFVPGVFGQALDTTEANGPGYVEITGFKGILGGNPFSITAWINTSDSTGTLIGWGSTAGGVTRFEFRPDADELRAESSGNVQGLTILPDNEWIHVAVTVKANAIIIEPDVTLYLNGQVDNDPSTGGTAALAMEAGYDVTIARRHTSGRWFDALIDDLRLYDVELTQAQVQEAMAGLGPTPPGAARDPSPDKETTDVSRDVVLRWVPGAYAPAVNGHIVYLSKSFNDVNDGIGGVTESAASYTPPQRLDFYTTYYWRVDEVNAPPDSTVHRGEVWSFTTEPVSYPIDANSITATASSAGQESTGPENTINGSGLDPNDLHSTNPTDMWASDNEPLGGWIQYEFDGVYKLHQMWVWNSNQVLEPLFGFGFKDVTIEYSTNGTDWAALTGVPEFARAPGMAGYAHDTTVDFGGAVAKYVKLTASSNWGGVLPQFGLSEVRFFSIPVTVREPSPDAGAAGVNPTVTLSWREGREASTHNVYVSTDQQAVIDGNVPSVSVTGASYSTDLDLAGTYYWRIDEVNDVEMPAIWQGEVWSFSTSQYLVVDDFEDYNDYPPHEIYTTWVDGYEVATNGSQVGNLTPPLAETTIIHSGKQSMPLFYSNTGGATYSEAERTFAAPQNWSKYGIQTLTLYFFGTAGNTGQLYVKINGTKIQYDGDAANLALAAWLPWNIDLTTSGLNLQSISSLSIGIDGNAAAGTLYFDDTRLYPYERQFITPAQPDPAGLVTYWRFDEGTGTVTQDSSPSGYIGTFMGDPQWVNGQSGGALHFDGIDDFVEYDLVADQTWTAYSVGVWAKADALALALYKSVFSSHTPNNFGFQMDVDGTDPGSYRYSGVGTGMHLYGPLTTDWVHLATTCDGTTTILYYNGHQTTTINGANLVFNRIGVGVNRNEDNFYEGIIDEFHLYDRALPDAEIAGLAGWTQPFDKPF